ncbi:MAG: DUF2723 domain-containing protein [Chloroflexota bacterium]
MEPHPPQPLTRTDALIALALTATCLLVYDATLAPSLSHASPDGNELATIPYVLGLAHSPGYPLYTWLGKLFTLLPIGDIAHRLNLMSAVLGAAAVGGLYALLASLLYGPPILRCTSASLAALVFAFSPTFWSQAVIAEVYAPNLALVALSLLAVLRWERTARSRDLFLCTLTFGLSLGTHLSNLGFAPAMGLFLILTHPRRLARPTTWFSSAAGFVLGAAQFLWLPLRAATLNDRLMLGRAPTSLTGLYQYTLGAFPQFKFAFPLAALPDRLVIYLDLLRSNFGLLGIALGVVGLAALLLRRPRHYFLFVGMYLVNVWFFIQYRAFDLEVFFLPAHFLWSVFLGFGLFESLGWLSRAIARVSAPAVRRLGFVALALGAAPLPIIPLAQNWSASDQSQDVAVNDFYSNVWELLPRDAALLTQSGVFGYDAFYWRLVYGTRPDVVLPALTTPHPDARDLADRNLYSTTPMTEGRAALGPGALPPGLLTQGLWQAPVLLGGSSEGGLGRPGALTLYHLTTEPPALVVDEAQPQFPLALDFGPLALIGADIEPETAESGGRIHLVLYWRSPHPSAFRISISLGDHPLEEHILGFGNLERYAAEVRPIAAGVIVEDYWLVVPSTMEPGTYALHVGLGGTSRSGSVGQVTVVNEQEAMERWLDVAGSSAPAP